MIILESPLTETLNDHIALARSATFSKLLQQVDRHAPSFTNMENNAASLAAYHMARNEAAKAEQAVRTAWAQGQRIGARHAMEDLKLLGRPTAIKASLSGSFLDQVLADLKDIPLDLTPEQKARRAAAAASVAANRGYADAQLEGYQAAGIVRKVWVTHFSANTCPTCAALHGQTASVTDNFGAQITFGAASPPVVYHDLQTPPRHPHCRCRILPLHEPALQKTGASPATMRAYAAKFAESKRSMAPLSWSQGELSDIAKKTSFMTSEDIRTMPEGRFQLARQLFRACAVRLRALRG